MNKQLISKIGNIVGEIKSITRLEEQGCTSIVQKITTNKGNYLLKSSFEKRYRDWLKQEAQVLEKLVNQTKIPVPHFYGFIEENDASHLIMSLEDGISLSSALGKAKDSQEKIALIKSFGSLLQQLHEIVPIDPLNHEGEWLEVQLELAERHLEQGGVDGDKLLLEKLKLHKPLPVKQTVIHGDCTTDNVLVINGEVKMFIDVAGMTVGDPRYDESLAIGRLKNHEEYLRAFYEGYKRYQVSSEEYSYFDEGLYEFF
ncbi:phosphotransferase [Ornithinibacillus californiensis]|uniref:phosphotransferase n=1 Tax=Ornithinibacillus californiensis TaxID=161536 RepID=UPI00064DB3C8|nr:phosphotransferase [Ornithinibacillus californiensis]